MPLPTRTKNELAFWLQVEWHLKGTFYPPMGKTDLPCACYKEIWERVYEWLSQTHFIFQCITKTISSRSIGQLV